MHSFSNALLGFQSISKTGMSVPTVEWGLYEAAHLPKMSGKSCPKKLLRAFSSGIKEDGLFTRNLGYFEMLSVPFKT